MRHPNVRWTADMDEYLGKKRREGLPFDQIAMALGVPRSSACSRCRKLFPNLYAARHRVHSFETRKAVVAMKMQGMSHSQIAAALGLRLYQAAGIWNHWRDYEAPRRAAA